LETRSDNNHNASYRARLGAIITDNVVADTFQPCETVAEEDTPATPQGRAIVSLQRGWRLDLERNRPLRTAIYISLCSVPWPERALFAAPPPSGEKWPPNVHFVPLICVPRDPSYLRFREPPRLRLISASSFRSAVFPKGSSRETRGIRRPSPPPLSARETNETRKERNGENRLCYSCSSPSPLPPSLLPSSRCFCAADSFSAGMKGKLRGRAEGSRGEEISLQMYVFRAYPPSVRSSRVSHASLAREAGEAIKRHSTSGIREYASTRFGVRAHIRLVSPKTRTHPRELRPSAGNYRGDRVSLLAVCFKALPRQRKYLRADFNARGTCASPLLSSPFFIPALPNAYKSTRVDRNQLTSRASTSPLSFV